MASLFQNDLYSLFRVLFLRIQFFTTTVQISYLDLYMLL